MNDELRLIRKIQKRGDRISADLLIRKYYDEIYCYVFKQTTNRDVAMDLTQNIFVSMLHSIASYDEKRAGFRTWLYRIATNKTIDHFRTRSTEQKYLLDINDVEIPDETAFYEGDFVERVAEFINSLDVATQQIFRLKFWGEYTFAKVAELLNLPEATVKTKYYRLLKTLKEEFKDENR